MQPVHRSVRIVRRNASSVSPLCRRNMLRGYYTIQAYRMNFGEEASTPATFAKSGTDE